MGAPTGFTLGDYEMTKRFTRKPLGDEPATRGKNYITRSGLQRLKDEHRFLLTRHNVGTGGTFTSFFGSVA